MPFEIKRQFYTMASADGLSAEITMYGDIVETTPVDWWTGEELPGEYISQDAFLEDLKALSACKDITIRMNSCGGDAGVAVTIHNRLRELAREGKNLTCIVDGAAMSGGSLIMCACDTVKVNPSSLIMIHKCWSYVFGGYNADDLRQMAEQADAYDEAQVSIYARKCKLSDTQISHMMSDETYMTGREAVEKGFADELIEDAEPTAIAASANRRSIYVKGRQIHMAHGTKLPESIPTVTTPAAAAVGVDTKSEPDKTGKIAEGEFAMNESELREKYPEVVAQIENAAKASAQKEAYANAIRDERQRLKDIDKIAAQCDADMVAEARYGENACDARELAFRAMQKASEQGRQFLADAKNDTKESGAGDVTPANDEEGDGNEDPEAEAKALAKEYLRMTKKGGKKE